MKMSIVCTSITTSEFLLLKYTHMHCKQLILSARLRCNKLLVFHHYKTSNKLKIRIYS